MTPFARHAWEMVLSMAIPMAAFGLTVFALLPLVGVDARPGDGSALGVGLVVVALAGMTVPMAWLMRARGHSWRHVGEMTLAMFAPMIVFVPLVRMVLPAFGFTPAMGAMLPFALVAMTGGMLALMFFQRSRYEHDPAGHGGHVH